MSYHLGHMLKDESPVTALQHLEKLQKEITELPPEDREENGCQQIRLALNSQTLCVSELQIRSYGRTESWSRLFLNLSL